MTTLADFLNEQAAQERAEAPERERKRDEWIQAIERLLQSMEEWIREADRQAILHVERTRVEHREQGLGHYSAPCLIVTLGIKRIDVVPVARNVVGRVLRDGAAEPSPLQGRVDVTDGVMKHTLYRLTDLRPDEWIYLHGLFEPNPRILPFDRARFEAILVSLMR